jgi:hypothetical protein
MARLGPIRREEPRRLLETATDPVSFDSLLHRPLGDGEAEARRPLVTAPAHFQDERAAVRPRAPCGREVIAPLLQALDHAPGGGHADRRLRPLARRRASTLRPFFVAMRARNPWRRLRTSRLG